MKNRVLKYITKDLAISIVLGLFIGWLISLFRENAPPFYFGGVVLGGYSLIKGYLKIKRQNKLTQ